MDIKRLRETPILMYHSISDATGPEFRDFVIPPTVFKEQMSWLHDAGYTTLTVSEFVAAMQDDQELPERRVMLTFDDAFVDFVTDALPILNSFGFQSTVYIPTAYVGQTSLWMEDIGEGHRPIMDWDALRQLPPSVECGAHSHTHPQLDILSRTAVRDEIAQCKHLLDTHLDRPVRSFCYPHGYSNRSVRRFVREAGFTSACAGTMPTDDWFALSRIWVKPDQFGEHFKQLLTKQPSQLELRLRPIVSVGWRMVRQFRTQLNA